jgi:hypothetical protein
MDTPRGKLKLDEARFFLSHLADSDTASHREPRACNFYLSAFLNAAYSVTEMLEREMKRELRKGAGKKKTAGKAFGDWLAE